MNLEKEKILNAACDHFRAIVSEQLDRAEKMKVREIVDFTALDRVVIGFCGGDGIGPVITREAMRVLGELLKEKIDAGRVELRPIEGLTIENRLAVGKAIPDDTLAEIKKCHVILKGPTETPHGTGMESANVAMRRELDLYANVRPVKVPAESIDWTFFRENTEGEYVLGSRGFDVPGTLAFDFKVTTDEGTRRIARAAFEYAKKTGKKSVSIVTKANIMKKTDAKFSAICHEVAADYPGITAEDWYIDIMTANLLNKNRRSQFEVFVLPNLYGDIITDEAAEIGGGVGTAGSANIGDRYAMFEAIHGSAPRMIERGHGAYANPTSIMRACVLMLDHIGFTAEARRLSAALDKCTEGNDRVVMTGRPDGATAAEFAEAVMRVM